MAKLNEASTTIDELFNSLIEIANQSEYEVVRQGRRNAIGIPLRDAMHVITMLYASGAKLGENLSGLVEYKDHDGYVDRLNMVADKILQAQKGATWDFV